MNKFIGYADSALVSEFSQISLGDYVVRNKGLVSGESSLYSIVTDAAIKATVTGSGDALFTAAGHGRSNGDKVGVNETKYYRGYYTVSSSLTNTFKLTKLDGTILQWVANESNVNFYVIGANHDNKNFSIGVWSHGKACYDKYLISSNVADLSTSLAYLNHYSNGQMKVTGSGSGNYTGPIGNRRWFIFDVTTAPVTNSGGDALVTLTSHGIDTRYIWIKVTGGSYASRLTDNYWYVESISANTFKLKTDATGTYLPYSGIDEDIEFTVTLSASTMQGLDEVGSETNPVISTNIGRVYFRKAWESSVSYCFSIWG